MKVIVTGASGVLGSAVKRAFEGSQYDVLGLSFSRTGDGLEKLDLTNNEEVEKKFAEFKPDWVIHCAAERRPDVAEKDPAATKTLNAEVPARLAFLAKKLGYTLVYISTDYVFDGTSPPYAPSALPNPLNLYGKTKREGELGALAEADAKVVILRVPVLYGPAPKNSDSAINVLLDVVQDQTGKKYSMDHYATRYPTNIVDVAQFLVRLTELKKPLPTILHYSADEPYTKYEICLVFAKILGLPHGHIIPNVDPPSGPDATTRPRDCRLDTSETELLGMEGGLNLCLFEEWWAQHLSHK